MRGSIVYLVILLVVASSTVLVAQTTEQELNQIQQELDELQEAVGLGDNVSERKIEAELSQLEKIAAERDSLALLLELTKAELMLCETDHHQITKDHQTLSNQQDSMTAKTFTVVHSTKGGNAPLYKGMYVVVASSRDKAEAAAKLDKYAQSDEDSNFMLVQNLRHTWYHVCMRAVYTKANVGGAVHIARKKGYADAWSIALD